MKAIIKQAVGCLCAVLLPSVCAAQATLEWMRATPAQRKRIEERLRREALSPRGRNVQKLPDWEGAGIRLGTFLDEQSFQRLMKTDFTVILDAQRFERVPFFVVSLPGFRAVRRWNLSLQTHAVLMRQSDYSYRLDFSKSNFGELRVDVKAVENKGAQAGWPVGVRFFLKRLSGRTYGLFFVPFLQKNPAAACTEEETNAAPVRLGTLYR